MSSDLEPVAENLFLIPLTPPLKGFEDFIGAWLHVGEPCFLVDVGPASTVETLFEHLLRLEVNQLDYVLLTHIHLDHAGAVGQVAARFRSTPIVCPGAGIPHLIDPQRLWEGSKKVLGRTALGYGPVTPVAAPRLLDAASFSGTAVRPVATPGHAAHHVSYILEDFLFAGETAGVWKDLGSAGEYLRPATPPRFFLDTALDSIEQLTASAPRWLCYGHFGMGAGARERLKRQRDQLLFWERSIHGLAVPDDIDNRLEENCLELLLADDPLLANFNKLPPPVRERERHFLRNSIRGFLGWLQVKAERAQAQVIGGR